VSRNHCRQLVLSQVSLLLPTGTPAFGLDAGSYPFLWRAMLEIYHCLLPGRILFGSTCTTVVAVAGQNPGSEGALSSSPILPALNSTSGCRFEVGPVGLAPPEDPHGRGCSQELSYSKGFDPNRSKEPLAEFLLTANARTL
jgi:hypothetical protein